MQIADPDFPITAIAYTDGAAFETYLCEITRAMTESGLRLAGLVQHRIARPGRRKCDMVLRDLATGTRHPISEDRGPLARGCVLNTDLLLRACVAAEASLSSRTELLVLCKFGKTEVEGGGVRGLIVHALDLGVPVLIGVPAINLASFRTFAGGLARELPLAPYSAEEIPSASMFRDYLTTEPG